ncbi:MAG: hypothetical protein FWF51_03300 [Chitinivibrionia bacterium]|nr:hypothetical protein [Chitinivibrionia bacterium]
MENKTFDLRFSVICAMILFAALSRLIPHPPNFAPITAMALFGATYYVKRRWAFFIPIAAMWISDLILNNVIYGQYFDHFVWFYAGSLFTYGAFALIVLLGLWTLKTAKTQRVPKLFVCSLGGSAIFFIASNFGVWFSGTMYSKDLNGLIVCYIAGAAFLKNTLIGDLFYCAALFGTFEISALKFAKLRLPQAQSLA